MSLFRRDRYRNGYRDGWSKCVDLWNATSRSMRSRHEAEIEALRTQLSAAEKKLRISEYALGQCQIAKDCAYQDLFEERRKTRAAEKAARAEAWEEGLKAAIGIIMSARAFESAPADKVLRHAYAGARDLHNPHAKETGND